MAGDRKFLPGEDLSFDDDHSDLTESDEELDLEGEGTLRCLRMLSMLPV
jgi:hypothetical protein